MLTIYALYVMLCCVVAYFGRDRKFRFWGYLVASLLLSPMIGALLVLVSDKRPAKSDIPR